MTRARSLRLRLRIWLAALCLLLPTLALVPLGVIWLWQKGYVLYWIGGAFAFVLLVFLLQFYLFRRIDVVVKSAPPERPKDETAASWTPREEEAWKAVLSVADTADIAHLTSWEAFLGLGKQTIEAVAKTLHPEVKDPLWQFTVPEALTLTEQVSVRLRPVIAENIPFGDQLTVGQVIRVYQWSGYIDTAQRAYDVWRIVRLLNPMTAATQEIRERMSRQMYQWGREEVAKRIAQGYVKEVGRAAIDLYGGRLRVSPADLEAHVSAASQRDRAAPKVSAEPLRILVGGQVKAGKSSLINALLAEIKAGSDVLPLTENFTAYELKVEGVPQALILDSPGLDSLDAPLAKLVEEAAAADLILWVSSAVRADREIDARALRAIRDFFAAHPERRRPPMLLVLSHVDLLRPMRDWAPPYDLADTANAKAASMREAIAATGADLGFEGEDIVPACLDERKGPYNVDALWAEILELTPEAKRAQLVRTLRDAGRGFNWRRVRSQALNAGRIVTGFLLDRGDGRPPPSK